MASGSVYIAIVPYREDQDAIAIPRVEVSDKVGRVLPEHIHLTLVYLGKASSFSDEERARLSTSVARFAESQSPLHGTVGGVGSFLLPVTEGGKSVHWRGVDIEGLADLRQALIEHLAIDGFQPFDDRAFNPHISVAYAPRGVKFEVPALEMPISVESVTLFIGSLNVSYELANAISLPGLN